MAGKSRPARWTEAIQAAETALGNAQAAYAELETAMGELVELQSEYEEWKANLPENLQQSALGEKLDAVTSLDLEFDTGLSIDELESKINEASGADLPLGFGKD